MEIEAETRRSPSLDPEELRHFEKLAKEWWDERGKFRGLHAFNPRGYRLLSKRCSAGASAAGKGFVHLRVCPFSILDAVAEYCPSRWQGSVRL